MSKYITRRQTQDIIQSLRGHFGGSQGLIDSLSCVSLKPGAKGARRDTENQQSCCYLGLQSTQYHPKAVFKIQKTVSTVKK